MEVLSGTSGDFSKVGNCDAEPSVCLKPETGHAGEGVRVGEGTELIEDVVEFIYT